MVKGKQKDEYITIEKILESTNGGYDIYKYYLGSVKRVMQRPWGRKEKKLSWSIFPRDGKWLWKDHATEEAGNAIQFTERYFGITLKESLDKLAWDFGLKNKGQEVNRNPVKVDWEVPKSEDEYAHISFESKPFGKAHHEFWNSAEITESWCNKFQCWAVKSAAINRKIVRIAKDEIVFAFYCPEEDGVKLYFPDREKGYKFRNNVSYHYLWNFENIKSCDHLIVNKSCKDMIVTAMITECVIATQAEAVKIFNKEVVDKINNITKTPWIWYGSDFDGVKKCKEITDTNKWKYINTPKNLLPEINDQYLYVKKFGLKKLEEFMKLKNII